MDNKSINKQIRSISNLGSLLVLLFLVIALPINWLLDIFAKNADVGSLWHDTRIVYVIAEAGKCLLIYPLLFAVYYKLLNRKNGLRLKDVNGKSQRNKLWIFKWTVMALGCSFGAEKLVMLASKDSSKGLSAAAAGALKVYSNNDALGWIIYAVSLIVLAPIFEELLFRGTIYRNNEPIGQLPAAVITGVMFGMWHLSFQQAVGAAVFGVFLCLVFAKTRSIKPVMIMHSSYNTVVFLITFAKFQFWDFFKFGDKEFMIHAMFHKEPVFAVFLAVVQLLMISLYIAAAILLIVEIIKRRGKLGLSKGEFVCPTWKKALVFLSAPVTLIVFAVMAACIFL